MDHVCTNPQDSNRSHNSHLSNASSIYSIAQRQSILPEHFTSTRIQPEDQSTCVSSQNPQSASVAPSNLVSEGTRRSSDASSHHPHSSNPSSIGNSHRNTRELGDFYDSYWRQSGQSIGPYNAGTRERERSREGRRQDRLKIEVPIISKIENSKASLASKGVVGIAL